MKTKTIESSSRACLALDQLNQAAATLRATEIDVPTLNRQFPPSQTAAQNREVSPPAPSFRDFNGMVNVINVLIVADCENDLIPRLADLEPRGYVPLHHRVETQETFLAALKSHAWDIIISDHVLQHFSAPEALKLLRNQGSDIPFIMVSGVFGEEKAATMMKAGANDYLFKENLSRLVPVLERELKAAENRRRYERAVAAMQHLAAAVHEPQNAAGRGMIACGDNGTLEPQHFGQAKNNHESATATTAPSDTGAATGMAGTSGDFLTLRELEKRHVFAALDRSKGNRTKAVALLGISGRTLRNKLREYDGTSPKRDEDKAVKV